MSIDQESAHLQHQPHRTTMIHDPAATVMRDSGYTTARQQQSDSRAPLRPIPPPPPPGSHHHHPALMKTTTTTAPPLPLHATTTAGSESSRVAPVALQEWKSLSTTSNTNNNKAVICAYTDSTATLTTDSLPVVESFEMEDITTGHSGGTSWTLRIPWLRNKNKRHRRLRQDDENSSIQTSSQSPSLGKPGMMIPTTTISTSRGDELNDTVYYGGLMKAGSSPSSVICVENNSNSIIHNNNNVIHNNNNVINNTGTVALAGDGGHYHHEPTLQLQLQLQETHAPTTLQPHPPQGRAKAIKLKRKQSSRLRGHKLSRHPPVKLDENLLPQHNIQPPFATAASGATNNNHRHYSMSSPLPTTTTTTTRLEPKNNNKVFRNRSWLSTSSRNSAGGRRHDEDSLADFDEAEWTPQDSAYGAAIPVCGWVPKKLRQGLEATLIAFIVFALVYLVVTTSISVQESKSTSGKHLKYNDSFVYSEFDDDWYVEFSQYANDEDDYFSNNNGVGDNEDGRDNDGNHGG